MTSLRSGVKLTLMKKLLAILVLGLLWCNIGLAEDKKELKALKDYAFYLNDNIINYGRKNLIAVIIPVGGEDCKYSLSGIQFFSCIWISALIARNPESNILSLLRSAIVPPIVA